MSNISELPLSNTLRPGQALAAAQKVDWHECIIVGYSNDGTFHIINSEVSAERALWLAKMLEEWAVKGEIK